MEKKENPVLKGPQDVARFIVRHIETHEQENFLVLLLNSKNRPICPPLLVSRGTLNTAVIHPRDIFREAIRQNAAAVVIAHNHPSGDLTPSREDFDTTRRIYAAGELLGIQCLDHLIVAESGEFYSFKSAEEA